METHLLFLGAGCSVPLGFPATSQLASEFEENTTNYYSTLFKAKHDIEINGFNYDVENLLEYFQGFSNPRYYLTRKGSFASSLCKTQPISKLNPDQYCLYLKNELEEHLITKCFKEGPEIKKGFKVFYDRLFAKISGISDWKTSVPNWNNHTFEIFTTNFDNSLDTYAVESDTEYTRGFIINGNDEVCFNPELFDRTAYGIKIIKIHGSVEFSKLEDGIIISKIPPTLPGNLHCDKKIESKVMVYGIEKILTIEPYLELLLKLKKSLLSATKCTVIGYSFRDEWVKTMFEEAVKEKTPENFSIDLIDPGATKIKESLPKLKSFINAIDMPGQKYLELES
ncbi:MAG: SIR2 family protein [Nitrosarchaeum sp.]|nr:SIR2 family protein [Nitrosarchaeum sp.]